MFSIFFRARPEAHRTESENGMNRRSMVNAMVLGVGGAMAAAFGWHHRQRTKLPQEMVLKPRSVLSAPDRIGSVFHLGHSLVGPDIPHMLAQLGGNSYASQIGWGTTLKAHWTEGDALAGYKLYASGDRELIPAHQALSAPGIDVLVMTEMVEIRDAINWFDSPRWLAEWAALARQGNSAIRIYLYETWHSLDDPGGWLERIDNDLKAYWQGRIIAPAETDHRTGEIFVIPGGQTIAAVARAAEVGELAGVTSRKELFARDEAGGQDMIHLNDLGAYVIALVHFTVIYHKSPVGLPYQLLRADGTRAVSFGAEAAMQVQRIVRDVVRRLPQTGVARERLS